MSFNGSSFDRRFANGCSPKAIAVAIKAIAPRAVFWLAASTVAVSGAVVSGCGGSSAESKQFSQAVTANRLGITSTYLQENNGYVHISGSQQFSLLGVDKTGAVIDLSDKATWRISDKSLGKIDSKGLFTPNGTAGELTLTAEFSGQLHSQALIISNADLVSISVATTTPAVSVCKNAEFSAEALFDNGLVLSYPVSWSVNPASDLAKFPDPEAPVLATYKSGTVNVVASGKNNAGASIQSAPVAVDIINNLSSVSLVVDDRDTDNDDQLRLREGDEIAVTVTATYVDGTSATITPNAQLTVSPTGAGSIDGNGKFVARSGSYDGTNVTLSGACDDQTAQLTFLVLKPQLESIEIINPNSDAASVSLTEGTSVRLPVTATYVDGAGSDEDYQHNLEWSIDESQSDSFDNDEVAIDSSGRLTTSRDLNLVSSMRVVVRARAMDDNGVPLLNREGEVLEDTIDVTINPREAE